MFRIVIFSDQSFDSNSWVTLLEKNFEVAHVHHPEGLLAVIDSWRPHVLIYFDQKVNPERIRQILNERKSASAIGWIVIGSTYNLRDEINSFSFGADHYLLKSTPSESLIARVQSLAAKIDHSPALQRTTVVALPHTQKYLKFGIFQLGLQTRSLQINGRLRSITPTQFRLLELFFSNVDQPLSREKIHSAVFNNKKMSMRSIDAHISKLKVSIPELQHVIVNMYGRGYLMKRNDDQAA